MDSDEIAEALAQLRALVERVRAIPDAEKRMIAAHELVKGAGAALVDFSDLRHLAANRLRAEDVKQWSYREIARALGLDSDHARQDAQAIVKGRPGRRASKRDGDVLG